MTELYTQFQLKFEVNNGEQSTGNTNNKKGKGVPLKFGLN